ncbi:MAG: ATP-binding cassette domain-containing protein [Candidatus Hydrogenedentes bacterium]|nr:ATP-binding cassette domain-containing protein [Candidatus Hydrogenedentota bacterium]
MQPLLELQDVRTYFPVRVGLPFGRRTAMVKAVDGVTLDVQPGEVTGLVGESGCGKSTLARTIVQLVPATGGQIKFDGVDLRGLSHAALKKTRRSLQMVFQDPYASLNPRMTVLDALAEPLRAHRLAPRQGTVSRVVELLESVGLSARDMRKYPHEFSGGQRQRIAIARALALKPKLLVADEPVSALDVSVQAQILNLIAGLCKSTGLTLVFISHDLAVVRHISQRIAVMYLGKIVEIGPTERVFMNPLHPYTRALLHAIPIPDPKRDRARMRQFLPGEPPSPLNPPAGCAFHPRCPYADERCKCQVPAFDEREPGHAATCLKLDSIR